jgi:PAS domain-containing protein
MANQWDEGLLMKKKVEKKKPAKIAKFKPLKSKKPEKPQRKDQGKYRILVENSQDGSFILKDGKVVLANKAFASMTGYHVNSLLGLDFKSLCAAAGSSIFTCFIATEERSVSSG